MQWKEREEVEQLITPGGLLVVITLAVLVTIGVCWLADSIPEIDKVDIKGMQETAQRVAEQGGNR